MYYLGPQNSVNPADNDSEDDLFAFTMDCDRIFEFGDGYEGNGAGDGHGMGRNGYFIHPDGSGASNRLTLIQ